MHTKITNFHELSKLLSVKNNVEEDIMTYFVHFGLGHLLHRLSLEKQGGISAVQLILSLCLFRINGESIHSIYKKSFYDLLDTGKELLLSHDVPQLDGLASSIAGHRHAL
jgi:hypothetical protein